MTIEPRMDEYEDEHQIFWYRDINETTYSFCLNKAQSRIEVNREYEEGWVAVHTFSF